jgi:ketosteroid isomerase-like protein
MHITKSTVIALGLAMTAFAVPALGKKHDMMSVTDATAVITAMENSSVKADMAGDSSYIEKNYADNYTGGSSWGNWETKQSLLADMKDKENNKTTREDISELNVRIYGNTGIATYRSTYEITHHGQQRARTIMTTDTFVRQDGSWKQVASHSSELAK